MNEFESRLQRIEAQLAIQQLPVRYAVAIDGRDLDAWVGLFSPNVDCGQYGRGREALKKFIEPAVRTFYRSIHQICGHVIELIDTDHAKGKVYCRAEHEAADKWVVMAICYFDTYERHEGNWYFSRRSEKHWYSTDVLERPGQPIFQNWEEWKDRAPALPHQFPTWQSFWEQSAEAELTRITSQALIARTRAMRLPLTVREITPVWLTEVLSPRHPDWEVEGVDVLDVIDGTSTKIRVKPRWRFAPKGDLRPTTLIVKGGFAAHSPDMQPMYLNEMRFYRDVQHLVAMHSPVCYFADTDPASHQSIVIMEDLRRPGLEFCDPLRPQTYAQVARRLASIARYHAQTWNSAEFETGGRLAWVGGRHEGWSLSYQQHYLEPERWQHYMQLPRSMAVPKQLRDREWMTDALQYLGDYHRGWPLCLSHGDTHLGNLYMEADGEPGFFDAQISRGPWQLEVTYHLVAALDIADRRRWEHDLLQGYFVELASHGVDVPPIEAAWEAHRREIAYGLFIFLINETRFQTESINTAYTARFGAAALDHQTAELTAAGTLRSGT